MRVESRAPVQLAPHSRGKVESSGVGALQAAALPSTRPLTIYTYAITLGPLHSSRRLAQRRWRRRGLSHDTRQARALRCWVVRGSGRACEVAGGTRCALNASERPVHAMSRQNCPDLRPRSPAPHERAIAPHAPLGTRLSALRTSQGPSGPRAPMVSMCSNGWNASSRGVTWPVFHMKISLKGL